MVWTIPKMYSRIPTASKQIPRLNLAPKIKQPSIIKINPQTVADSPKTAQKCLFLTVPSLTKNKCAF